MLVVHAGKFIYRAVMVVDGGFWMCQPRPPILKETMRQLSISADNKARDAPGGLPRSEL